MINDNEEGLTVHNDKHLEWALRQLSLMEMGLASLRTELADKNPALLTATSPAYERRIATLQQEIANYLHRNPPAVSMAFRKTIILSPGELYSSPVFAATKESVAA